MSFKKYGNKSEKNSDVSQKIPKLRKSDIADTILITAISVIVVIGVVIAIKNIDLNMFFNNTDDAHSSEQSETSMQSTINLLTESTSEHTEPQTEEENLYIPDSYEIQNHYPVEFIGKTVEETIDILGMPQDIKGGFLGGGGTDTAYLYDDGNVIFIALYDFSDNYDFDDRDARINYISIWDGSVNEYVEMGMSYNEINQFYSLSDYSYSAIDNCYTATVDFMCNNCNCTLIITSSDGNKTTPINRILLTCKDVHN